MVDRLIAEAIILPPYYKKSNAEQNETIFLNTGAIRKESMLYEHHRYVQYDHI